MPIKAIIIDDERLARAELKRMLLDVENILVIGEAANAEEGKALIESERPDLIFLDIQMPGKTGFQLLEELEEVPNVIFTTAYDEFALKAFQFNALDYLLKPIHPERLEEAVRKVRKSQQGENNAERMAELRTINDRFFVKDGDKCWFVRLGDVRLFESSGNYTKVYFGQFKPLILKSLNALEDRLDERAFFRCSRKHIVNLSAIDRIEPSFNGGLSLYLTGGEEVEVSRRQTAKFKEVMSL